VTWAGSSLTVCGRRTKVSNGIYVIALGKAATTMALGLEDALGDALSGGVFSGPDVSLQQLSAKRWQAFAGGHPLPNEASLAAGRAALELLDQANSEGTVVMFLVSGGGSAMIESPVSDDITLADLQVANQILTSCGARINEINSVRRGFSAMKGGGLVRRVSLATVFTLIVSDTNAGDEANVASGPTLFPPADSPTAMDVVNRFQLEPRLPKSIMASLKRVRAEWDSANVQTPNFVLLDNQAALAAAANHASSLGLAAEIHNEICEQSIDEGSRLLLDSEPGELTCLISGGEFSCPVRGEGLGGRNLETVLRCAIELDKKTFNNHCVVLSAGTDGIDGNSPAAGAIADETTIARARALGLNAEDFLARSDSYSFFEKLGDLIITGPTGTNVRDLRFVLLPS
jgi:hydroxypyruvate reductase